jgi:hypothetical protein
MDGSTIRRTTILRYYDERIPRVILLVHWLTVARAAGLWYMMVYLPTVVSFLGVVLWVW